MKINISYDYDNDGFMLLAAQVDDVPAASKITLNFWVKDPSGSRKLKSDTVKGEAPLVCTLTGIDVSEADREGATYLAYASATCEEEESEEPPQQGSQQQHSNSENIFVFGCKQAIDCVIYKINLERTSDKFICFQGELSIKTRDGYEIVEVEPESMSLKFSTSGEDPQPYPDKLEYREGKIKIEPNLFKTGNGQSGLYFLFTARLRVRDQYGKVRIIPVSYDSRSSSFYE